MSIRTNAPSSTVWIVAVIIGILGIVGHLTPVEGLTANSFYLVMIGFVILAVASIMKGL